MYDSLSELPLRDNSGLTAYDVQIAASKKTIDDIKLNIAKIEEQRDLANRKLNELPPDELSAEDSDIVEEAKKSIDLLELRLADQRGELRYENDQLTELNSLRTQLSSYLKEISDLDELLSSIDRTISETDEEIRQAQLSSENLEIAIDAVLLKIEAVESYRTYIAGIFALLISIVMIGFYIIGYRLDEVASAVFGSDAGIQFLTMFSIIIAIILFGLVGILESKELSALLGGLSGYILGRGGSTLNAPRNE